MDDDFGGDFFENEDYGAFEEEGDLGFEKSHVEEAEEQAVATSCNTTSEPLTFDSETINLPSAIVTNCLAQFDTNCELDLRLLTISTRNIEYNPRRANNACLRFARPRLTALIMPCGRVTVCGRATLKEIKHQAKVTAKILQKAGHPHVRFTDFKVVSLVCTACCGFAVRLENLSQDHAKFCSYEPEIFCGVIYRYNPSPEQKATVLIFVSGRLVITGCRSLQKVNEVYKSLYAVLYLYRK